MNKVLSDSSFLSAVSSNYYFPKHRKFSDTPSFAHDFLLDALFTQPINVGLFPESPSHRVKELIEGADVIDHPVYCEMLELGTSDDNETYEPTYWRQRARWIKYEEIVEIGDNRFSHPYLTLLSIQSILQLRNCLRKGAFLVDAKVESYEELVDKLVSRWMQIRQLDDSDADIVRNVLCLPKHHLIHNRLKEGTVNKKQPLQRENSSMDNDVTEDEPSEHSNAALSTTPTTPNSKAKGLMKKLAFDCEAATILIGHVEELRVPLSGFVRLEQALLMYPELPDIAVPVKFIFVLLVPIEKHKREVQCIGSAMGTILVDEVYRQVAYNAMDCNDLCDGIDEYLGKTIILPAGKWNPDFRWEPIDDMPPTVREVGRISYLSPEDIGDEAEEAVTEPQGTEGLHRTGRIFGGVIEDVKRKSAWYVSDFTDVYKRGRVTQSIAAAIFLFFSNITKIITFGGVMGHMLNNEMAAVENLLSGGICGVTYALFSGQPLSVLSATGPTLVFEAILYDLCGSLGWSYLPARFWVGFWTAVIILFLVALDASTVVALITRFTEEAFATLISIIFIVQSFEELYELIHHAPLTPDPLKVLNDPCVCSVGDGHFDDVAMILSNQTQTYPNMSVHDCHALNGTSTGAQCYFHPDVFLFSILLFLGTFTIAIGLKFLRHSGYFPHLMRHTISDFGVFTAIVSMTLLNWLVGLDVETLNVPNTLRPTLPTRGWIINPLDVEYWYIPLLSIFPALFFTILVVMDQQITSVIINRKDNKLRKGHGYHLDILVISLLMLVCSTMGIPFYVAATVISIMHVDSLRLYSECSAPGEKPQFLGVKEQRVTALLAHIMIGLAVFLTPVIKVIPISVLLGIFLYMGVVSLMGQQFVQRIMIIFMPMKHQPDYSWLRIVRLKRVHLFTLIQIISLIALFVVKYIKSVSIVFPIMLVVMVVIRKLLDNLFTQKELRALDDPLPKCRDIMTPQRRNAHSDRESNGVQAINAQSRPLVSFSS